MVKNKRLEFCIDAPWELAVFAYDDKMYRIPIPEQPEVLSMEFFNFHWDSETDVTTLSRKSRAKIPVPGFLMRAVTDETEIRCKFDETIDRRNRRIVTLMENTNLENVVKIIETTTFTPHPSDPANKTMMVTDCNMNLKSSFWGASKVEGMVTKIYANGIINARKRDVAVIANARAKLEAEGRDISTLLCQSEEEAREYMHEMESKKAAEEAAATDSDDSDEFYDADEDAAAGAGDDTVKVTAQEAKNPPKMKLPADADVGVEQKIETSSSSIITSSMDVDADLSVGANSTGASGGEGEDQSTVRKKKKSPNRPPPPPAFDGDSADDMLDSKDGDLKPGTRKERMKGTIKKLGISSLWAAGVAAKAAGRAAVAAKRQAAKGAVAVRKRGGTISKRWSSKSSDPRGSAYHASVLQPYSWKQHAGTREYETALIGRRMQIEVEVKTFKAESGDDELTDDESPAKLADAALKKEYDEIMVELGKVLDAKLNMGSDGEDRIDTSEQTEKLLSYLGENPEPPGPVTAGERIAYLARFLDAIGTLYDGADQSEIEMAKEKISNLTEQMEALSLMSPEPNIEDPVIGHIGSEIDSVPSTAGGTPIETPQGSPKKVNEVNNAVYNEDDLESWLGPADSSSHATEKTKAAKDNDSDKDGKAHTALDAPVIEAPGASDNEA